MLKDQTHGDWINVEGFVSRAARGGGRGGGDDDSTIKDDKDELNHLPRSRTEETKTY